MEQKYLPIGSVCTLKGRNKKVMITGYYSVEFSGNLKIKDYSGCAYPEGMLLPSQVITFNHVDIENIDFIGFQNEEQRTFNSLLDRLTGNTKTDEEKASDFHKQNDMFLTSNSSYSKLLFDENGVVMIAEPIEEKKEIKQNTLKNIKFDENGYVISADDNTDVSNPFHKEYKNSNKVQKNENPSSWNIFKNIEFDENGTVISADTIDESKKSGMLSEIKFDENGTVISVGKEQLESADKKYRFDDNGTLIAVGDETLESINNSQNSSNLPKVGEYKFDENGVVISE